jgi:drug/metabolite transporter (DMT)-like permease
MALFAALFSAALAGAKDLLSKRLAFDIDGTTSTFASFGFALPFYVLVLAVLAALGLETFDYSLAFFGFVVLRASTDTIAEWMKMHAFNHGDISLVSTFFAMSPLFLLIASPFLTNDPFSIGEAIAVVVVVLGSLVLVYRPSSTGWREQRKAILLATGAAIFFGLNSCFDRRAMQEGTAASSPAFAGFTMTLLSALLLLPFIVGNRKRQAALWDYQGTLWLRGLFEVLFMVPKLFAMQHMHAPLVVGLMRLSLLFSIVGGRVFFKEGDFARRLAAGALIVAGAVLIAWLHYSPTP